MPEEISIALCSDLYNLAGLLITVNSIVKNCSEPERLHFYILVDSEATIELTKAIFETYMPGVRNTIEQLEEQAVNAISGYQNFCGGNKHCRNLMNFARFYLPLLFPNTDHMIYIDTDFLVVDDIVKLWSLVDKKSEFYAVPSEYTNEMAYALTKESTVDLSNRPPFNAGIYVMNCEAWREKGYTFKFLEMINDPVLQKSFRFGTQPLLNYKFQETYVQLPTSWNRVAYDYVREIENRPITLFNNLSKEELIKEGVSALHFAGTPKPWSISQALSSGNWPSPRDIYRGYLPYKNTLYVSMKLIKTNQDFFKRIKNICQEVFGVDVIVTEDEKSKKVTEYLLAGVEESQITERSNINLRLIGKKIVDSQGIRDIIGFQSILESNKIEDDGFYVLNTNTGSLQKKPLFYGTMDLSESQTGNQYSEKTIMYALIYRLLNG